MGVTSRLFHRPILFPIMPENSSVVIHRDRHGRRHHTTLAIVIVNADTDSSNILQKEQHVAFKVVKLLANALVSCWRLGILEQVEGYSSPKTRLQNHRGVLPFWRDHAHSRISGSMDERERIVSRLYVNLPGHLEHRLEPYSFLADVSIVSSLGALSDATDGLKVDLIKTILVTVDDYLLSVQAEVHTRYRAGSASLSVLVVVGILQEFEDEADVLGVELSGESAKARLIPTTNLKEGAAAYSMTEAPIILSLISRASWTSRRVSWSIRA